MNSVITDRAEIEALLSRGSVADIGEFIKQAAKDNPDLVPDPQAFEEQWEKDKAAAALAEYKERAPEAIGTKRAELAEVLEEHGIGLAESYADLTDKQKAYGQVTSRLSFASSIDDIEKIFTWADIQFGQFSMRERCLAIFQGAELIGTSPANYRGIRKMFLEIVHGNDVEIKPEYLEARDAREAVQKAVCAKLIKAKSPANVEDIFSWAEVELGKQIGVADRYIVFFQIAEMIRFDVRIYKAIRKVLCRMNKD